MPILFSITLILLSLLCGGVVSWYVTKRHFTRSYNDNMQQNTNFETAAAIDLSPQEITNESKVLDEYDAMFNSVYRKGVEDGEKKALSRFSIKYDDYEKTIDSFFNKKVNIGYTMQLFYEGLPIGDQMVKIIYHNEKVKEDNVKYLVETVQETIQQIGMQASTKGIPVMISNKKSKSIQK